jgi:hypothetical protein
MITALITKLAVSPETEKPTALIGSDAPNYILLGELVSHFTTSLILEPLSIVFKY